MVQPVVIPRSGKEIDLQARSNPVCAFLECFVTSCGRPQRDSPPGITTILTILSLSSLKRTAKSRS